jgi:serine-type D-Ala-D-Ala carboxypeptidase/endopeptidase
MFKLSIIVCLIMPLSPLVAEADTSSVWRAGGSLNQSISQLGQEYLDLESGTGLSIGIIESGQSHIFHFGTTKKRANRLPDDQTVYEIGSIAKTFAGLVLARAVLEGKVKLDDKIEEYLDGEYPNLAYHGEPVRIVHLANMTSGLPNSLFEGDESSALANPGDVAPQDAENETPIAKRRFLQALHMAKVTERPGINPSHSNAAADLLRYILEDVYEDSWDDLVARFIEKPCHMQSGGITANRLRPQGYGSDGEEVPADAGPRYNMPDLLKYAAHQLDEEDEAVALSHKSTWDTLDKQQSIGFFWIASRVEDGRRLRYSGGTSGFSSFCGLYPERKLGIVLLANNASETAQDRLLMISEKIAEAIREASRKP